MRDVPEDDPEVKREAKTAVVTNQADGENDVLRRIISYFSSWFRLKKFIAWILRYRLKLLQSCRRRKEGVVKQLVNGKPEPISVEEMKTAEVEILKHVQKQSFVEELRCTRNEKKERCDPTVEKRMKTRVVKKSNPIYKLNPVIVNGLLCVGGRLSRAPIQEESKHPVILLKRHHVVDLIVRYYHLISGHSGKEHVLSLIREKLWIVKARVTVRNVINNCFDCKRRQTPVGVQKMADLPADRVTPQKPPFSFIGVDCFGPFLVKRGRSQVKRYGVLYTCLVTRAVHIEVAYSMDTDSFINSMRRFIARRGTPELMRSDNGTNFVGGNKELSSAISQWNVQQIHGFFLQKHIKWIFNPPSGSHHGGIWERCIRTVRKVFNAVLKEQALDDEGLSTLTCEVEAIVNSRPITKSSDDPSDCEALTPNHLLLLRSGPCLPPGSFSKEDSHSRRRWRQVQYLAEVFWRRWIREYLPQLQARQKWVNPSRSFAVGDIVLVVDERCPRSSWPLGRIVNVQEIRHDGLVRSVTLKTGASLLERPIDKIVLLESVETSEGHLQ